MPSESATLAPSSRTAASIALAFGGDRHEGPGAGVPDEVLDALPHPVGEGGGLDRPEGRRRRRHLLGVGLVLLPSARSRSSSRPSPEGRRGGARPSTASRRGAARGRTPASPHRGRTSARPGRRSPRRPTLPAGGCARRRRCGCAAATTPPAAARGARRPGRPSMPSEGSTASTSCPSATRAREALPVPQPRSTTRSAVPGAGDPSSQVIVAAGHSGRTASYVVAMLPKDVRRAVKTPCCRLVARWFMAENYPAAPTDALGILMECERTVPLIRGWNDGPGIVRGSSPLFATTYFVSNGGLASRAFSGQEERPNTLGRFLLGGGGHTAPARAGDARTSGPRTGPPPRAGVSPTGTAGTIVSFSP